MKIVIVGAGGGVGSVMADWLSRRDDYDEIVLAGRKRDTLKLTYDKMKGKEKAKIAVVNAGNINDMKKCFRGADMVVNSTLPRYFLKIMSACLATNANYVDMATDLAVMNEPPGQVVKRVPLDLQLDQDKAWKKKDLSAMLCWGVDPGAVNVFTRYAADRMDKVDEIKIRDGDKSYVEGFNEFYAPWSPDTLIEEVAYMNSLIWTKGHWERKEPVTVQEEWEFPKPVGKLKVTLVDHEETQSLPRFIGKGCKEMSFMLALGDDWLNVVKALRMVGLVDNKPVNARGVKVVPRDVIVACMASPVDPAIQSKTRGNSCVGSAVFGWKGDKKYMHYIWNTMSHYKCWQSYKSTATPTQVAIPTAIAVTLYAQGKIKNRGVYTPELIDANMMMRAFSKYGFEGGQMKKRID
jgi:saccharopine dehydrogenase-like NADP-dependent oxidoreductase